MTAKNNPMRLAMDNGKLIFSGPEMNKFVKAWYHLTRRREIVGKSDKNKANETILLLHSSILSKSNSIDEEVFCHKDLYGKYLKFCSDDFDRVHENRVIDKDWKFDKLLGWCNKKDRVDRFVVRCLAFYEKNEEIKSVSPPSKVYEDVYLGDTAYHFLLEDQFGRYYASNNGKIIVFENGETNYVDLESFVLQTRPKAHKVGTEYILRRLRVIEEPTIYQRRFIRKFEKRNYKNIIFSGKSSGGKKENSGPMLKVQWSGSHNRQKGKVKTR